MIKKAILSLLNLVERIDKYSECTKKEINDSYDKEIKIGNGTVNISVRYENVPGNLYSKSLNMVHECFSEFYEVFSEKVLSEEITDKDISD